MTEFEKLRNLFLSLHFTEDQATYSARKLINCKERIDRKYFDNEKEIPFFPSTAGR